MGKEIKQEVANAKKTFDDFKHVDEEGNEYWMARELAKGMGYEGPFRNFEPVIDKAKIQMNNTGINPDEHIAQLRTELDVKNQYGKAVTREINDYKVDRRGAYTMAVNADPHKPEVACAKEYFIQKTAKAEVMEKRITDSKRFQVRGLNSISNKEFSNTVLARDVEPNEVGIVISKGDEGMFNMSTDQFKETNNIPKSRPISDYLDTDVLAYKTVATINARKEIEKHDLHGVKDISEATYDENRKMREMFNDKFDCNPEDHPVVEDIKRVRRKYDKETEKYLAQFE